MRSDVAFLIGMTVYTAGMGVVALILIRSARRKRLAGKGADQSASAQPTRGRRSGHHKKAAALSQAEELVPTHTGHTGEMETAR